MTIRFCTVANDMPPCLNSRLSLARGSFGGLVEASLRRPETGMYQSVRYLGSEARTHRQTVRMEAGGRRPGERVGERPDGG